MLSLADGGGWAPIIMARVFVKISWFPSSVMYFFHFAAMLKHCGLSIIELAYSVKQSMMMLNNLNWLVKHMLPLEGLGTGSMSLLTGEVCHKSPSVI